jgi:hypothetical protein
MTIDFLKQVEVIGEDFTCGFVTTNKKGAREKLRAKIKKVSRKDRETFFI